METRTIIAFLAGFALFSAQALKADTLEDLYSSISSEALTCPPCSRVHLDSAPASVETTPGDLGSIDGDGVYHPKDKSVQRLYNAGDFKTYIDASLKNGEVSVGFAYELVDISYRLPRSAKNKLKQQDRTFDTSLKGMTRMQRIQARVAYMKERSKIEHKLRVPIKWPFTVDLAVDGNKIGFHFGTKLIGIIDLGPFLGIKWNFKHGDWERTVGLQLLKFSF